MISTITSELSTDQRDSHIAAWVKEHSTALRHWAYKQCRQKELSEDLVQETFVTAFQNLHSFKNQSQPRTWLMGILKNKIGDHYRRQLRQISDPVLTTDSFFTPEGNWIQGTLPNNWNNLEPHLLDNTEFIEALKQCMHRLPDVWAYVLRERYLNDTDSETICETLRITPSNYWQIMHRAKLQVRRCIEKSWFNN